MPPDFGGPSLAKREPSSAGVVASLRIVLAAGSQRRR